jgi:hypothetical protein
MAQTPEHRRLVRIAAGFNRNAAKMAVRGTITGMDLLWVEQHEPTCNYCGIGLEPGRGTFDHVVPLSQGGPNTWTNLVRSCFTCNRTKFTKSPSEMADHQSLLVSCSVCGKQYQPRWAEYQAGRARTCSRSCAARSRWA